jgi:hypothetical protein
MTRFARQAQPRRAGSRSGSVVIAVEA